MNDSAGIAAARSFVDELDGGNLESVRRFIAPEFFGHSPHNDEPSATEAWVRARDRSPLEGRLHDERDDPVRGRRGPA